MKRKKRYLLAVPALNGDTDISRAEIYDLDDTDRIRLQFDDREEYRFLDILPGETGLDLFALLL